MKTKDRIDVQIQPDYPLPGRMTATGVFRIMETETVDYRDLPAEISDDAADMIAEEQLRMDIERHIQKTIYGDVQAAIYEANRQFIEWVDVNSHLPGFASAVKAKFIEIMNPVLEETR